MRFNVTFADVSKLFNLPKEIDIEAASSEGSDEHRAFPFRLMPDGKSSCQVGGHHCSMGIFF